MRSSELIRRVEVEENWGIKRPQIAKMRMRSDGPPYLKISSIVYDRCAEVDAWLSTQQRQSTSDR